MAPDTTQTLTADIEEIKTDCPTWTPKCHEQCNSCGLDWLLKLKERANTMAEIDGKTRAFDDDGEPWALFPAYPTPESLDHANTLARKEQAKREANPYNTNPHKFKGIKINATWGHFYVVGHRPRT